MQLGQFHFEAVNSFEWKINGYSNPYFSLHRYTWKQKKHLLTDDKLMSSKDLVKQEDRLMCKIQYLSPSDLTNMTLCFNACK